MSENPEHCQECNGKFGSGPVCPLCASVSRFGLFLRSPRCPREVGRIALEQLREVHRAVLEAAEDHWIRHPEDTAGVVVWKEKLPHLGSLLWHREGLRAKGSEGGWSGSTTSCRGRHRQGEHQRRASSSRKRVKGIITSTSIGRTKAKDPDPGGERRASERVVLLHLNQWRERNVLPGLPLEKRRGEESPLLQLPCLQGQPQPSRPLRRGVRGGRSFKVCNRPSCGSRECRWEEPWKTPCQTPIPQPTKRGGG